MKRCDLKPFSTQRCAIRSAFTILFFVTASLAFAEGRPTKSQPIDEDFFKTVGVKGSYSRTDTMRLDGVKEGDLIVVTATVCALAKMKDEYISIECTFASEPGKIFEIRIPTEIESKKGKIKGSNAAKSLLEHASAWCEYSSDMSCVLNGKSIEARLEANRLRLEASPRR